VCLSFSCWGVLILELVGCARLFDSWMAVGRARLFDSSGVAQVVRNAHQGALAPSRNHVLNHSSHAADH
jgi:hypothetical protein